MTTEQAKTILLNTHITNREIREDALQSIIQAIYDEGWDDGYRNAEAGFLASDEVAKKQMFGDY